MEVNHRATNHEALIPDQIVGDILDLLEGNPIVNLIYIERGNYYRVIFRAEEKVAQDVTDAIKRYLGTSRDPVGIVVAERYNPRYPKVREVTKP